jgi:hypothetical protein
MVVAETIAGLGAVKTAFDMAKALQGIRERLVSKQVLSDLVTDIEDWIGETSDNR